MKIGITGATGHVGAALCRALLLDGNHQVRALVHRSKNQALSGLELEEQKGDILDLDSMRQFTEGLDVVIHLAAKISIDGDPDGSVYRINVNGTQNVVQAAYDNGVKKCIHFSSIHAMNPTPLDKELNETRPLVGEDWKGSAYDQSKAEAEVFLQTFMKKTGFHIVIISPTSIIGPFDFGPSLQGSALLDMYYGKLPALIKGGYDWVDVRDVAQGTIQAMNKGKAGEKYLLSGHFMSLKKMADFVASLNGKKGPKLVLPFWLAALGVPFAKIQSKLRGIPPVFTHEALHAIKYGSTPISHAKASSALDYQPRAIEETLKDALDWLVKNKANSS